LALPARCRLLNLQGNIPSFTRITDVKTHEVNVMDDLVLEPGAFYQMDRGYLDFCLLFVIPEACAFLQTRSHPRNPCFWPTFPHAER
jgi:hypothetical protein